MPSLRVWREGRIQIPSLLQLISPLWAKQCLAMLKNNCLFRRLSKRNMMQQLTTPLQKRWNVGKPSTRKRDNPEKRFLVKLTSKTIAHNNLRITEHSASHQNARGARTHLVVRAELDAITAINHARISPRLHWRTDAGQCGDPNESTDKYVSVNVLKNAYLWMETLKSTHMTNTRHSRHTWETYSKMNVSAALNLPTIRWSRYWAFQGIGLVQLLTSKPMAQFRDLKTRTAWAVNKSLVSGFVLPKHV